ncbi:hypothetical protein Syun_013311 [Stephania yunnanensis]|uniref:Peptidase C45 hydrolase domain-containing protein n=1 Tax=Stephania yunnanensis TaxID=152371 RepID=A0AAP0K152_9MAGN
MEKELEVFEVGPCEGGAYEMGFLIGKRFSNMIKSRLATDLILQTQLIPFATSPQSQSLIESLCKTNRTKYPTYWEELLGTAQGSGTETNDDCSDVLVVNDSMAVAAHNEDANVALVGHTYLIKATLSNGLTFAAYTYAGELPSCAFGFNSNDLAFTLNSVPPLNEEILAGAVGRNFISRDLLEATCLEDALKRIRSAEVSVGHSYNLIDVKSRNILNVETASNRRISVHEIGRTPFFHANMYLHLQVQQVQDENSMSRQRTATQLKKETKTDFLSLLGDTSPTLHTLCTVLIDLDEQTISIIQGNPKKGKATYVFPMSAQTRSL